MPRTIHGGIERENVTETLDLIAGLKHGWRPLYQRRMLTHDEQALPLPFKHAKLPIKRVSL
jgi:hypothetical protein